MDSFMTPKVTRIGIPFIAVNAIKWSITRMDTQVTCQNSLPVKPLITHITNVSFLWLCASVFVHVMHEVFFLDETFSTVSTSKKHMLSSVTSYMLHHVAFISEPSITVGTCVWLLSRVNEQVAPQAKSAEQCFLTDITSVAFHWYWHSKVCMLNMSF